MATMKTYFRYVFGSVLVGFSLLPGQSSAIDLLVYNFNNIGPGSLRQAIDENHALGGGNTIVFSNTVRGTIPVSGTELVIQTNVTIMGPGAGLLAVSGRNERRVFFIETGMATISGLSIVDGRETAGQGGAGIRNHGTLFLSDCVVSNCVTTVAGGGVYNNIGSLNLSNCLFTANSAGIGGGALSSSVGLTANRCAFINNVAPDRGGAIYITAGAASLNNSTIVSNLSSVGGGVYSIPGLTMTACTVVGNRIQPGGSNRGGGIYGPATVGNTIIAGNYSALHPDTDGTFTSQGYNLIGETNGSSGWGAVGDQLGSTNNPVFPNLAPLAHYGYFTPTMPPLAASAAIDKGKNFGWATDQRGRVRPFDNPVYTNAPSGDGSDIGAVELGLGIDLVVNNTNNGGPGSLRQAVLDASPTEGDTVTFAPNVTNTITLTSEILVNKNLTINGPGANVLRVSGNNSNRVFHHTGGTVSISGLTIANGLAGDYGGGILAEAGILSLSYCQFTSNSTATAFGSGGGICVLGSTFLYLDHSSVTHNQASFAGGGIYQNGPTFTCYVSIENSTIASNRTTWVYDGFPPFPHGGGISLLSGTLTVLDSTVANNVSTYVAGGIGKGLFTSGTAQILNTIVAGNTAASTGPDVAGAFQSIGYNLIGNSSGSVGFTNLGDRINVNPLLGPLANYGGPTLTMALRSGSPAIDQGFSVRTNDQRGLPRQLDDLTITNAANNTGGDAADIGAFEVDPRFRIVNLSRMGNDVGLSLLTVLGKNYRAEYTNDLASGTWTSFTNNVPGNGWLLWVTNIGGANQARRYFRGAIVP